MGVQPATLQSGLVSATKSTDSTPPTSTIVSPTSSSSFQSGVPITITGTATDAGGGVVAGVEVSVDGGVTWHPATGRGNWSYAWTPNGFSPVTIMSRAVDDSGNLEKPSAGVTVTPAPLTGTATIWSSTTTPAVTATSDGNAYELGVKFRSDVAGYITGIRFYKGSGNTGTHIGHLWTAAGTLLATATFTNETATGWQEVSFPSPVAIAAGVTYVASYYDPAGHYAQDVNYFATSGAGSGPLHALAAGVDGVNGVYAFGASAFPTSSWSSSNYWVDVVFSTTA